MCRRGCDRTGNYAISTCQRIIFFLSFWGYRICEYFRQIGGFLLCHNKKVCKNGNDKYCVFHVKIIRCVKKKALPTTKGDMVGP